MPEPVKLTVDEPRDELERLVWSQAFVERCRPNNEVGAIQGANMVLGVLRQYRAAPLTLNNQAIAQRAVDEHERRQQQTGGKR